MPNEKKDGVGPQAVSRVHQKRVTERKGTENYGPDYKALRRQLDLVIKNFGGWCMEEICVHPTRRIEPGGKWQLAHDHGRGGPTDLRGPAHPECNLDEMHRRKRLEKKREHIAAMQRVHAAPLKAA